MNQRPTLLKCSRAWTVGLLLLALGLVLATTPPGSAHADGDHDLYAPVVETAPVVDGAADDAVWAEAEPLTTGGNDVTLKALRSGDRLYLLAVWTDDAPDYNSEGWAYHTDDGEWDRSPDESEDALGFMWNPGDTLTDFNTEGPETLCMDEDNTMRTSGDDEVADLWVWHAGKTNYAGYARDRYLTNEVANGTGESRHSEEEGGQDAMPSFHEDSSKHGGFEANMQELNFTDDPDNSTPVPHYWKPNPGSGLFDWHIAEEDIDSGAAKEIVAVATDGSLTDEDNTTVPTDAKIPGFVQEVPEGSGGDIAAKGQYIAGQWTLELSRPLITSTPAEDIQFADPTGDYTFGVAKFNNAHGSGHTPSYEVYTLSFAEPKGGGDETTPSLGLALGLVVLGVVALGLARRSRRG